MQLKDVHPDMERYLKEDCYCPGEIYDVSGFFFQVFKADEECKVLVSDGKSKNGDYIIKCVICRDQIINFWIDDSKIRSAERYDATENNIKQIVDFWNGKCERPRLDEFKKGQTERNLADIMRYADAIMVSS